MQLGKHVELYLFFARLRKLERISQLDSEVNKLKEENTELAQVRHNLEEEARELRDKLKKHLDCGCIIESETGGEGFMF